MLNNYSTAQNIIETITDYSKIKSFLQTNRPTAQRFRCEISRFQSENLREREGILNLNLPTSCRKFAAERLKLQ